MVKTAQPKEMYSIYNKDCNKKSSYSMPKGILVKLYKPQNTHEWSHAKCVHYHGGIGQKSSSPWIPDVNNERETA